MLDQQIAWSPVLQSGPPAHKVCTRDPVNTIDLIVVEQHGAGVASVPNAVRAAAAPPQLASQACVRPV